MSAPKPVPSDRLLREIMAGHHDSHLMDLVEACGQRVRAGFVRTQWRVNWGGLDVLEDSLTLDEAVAIENEASEGGVRVNWTQLQPLTSAKHCQAVLVALLVSREGLSLDDARAKVGAAKVNDLADAITATEAHPDPLDSSASAT